VNNAFAIKRDTGCKVEEDMHTNWLIYASLKAESPSIWAEASPLLIICLAIAALVINIYPSPPSIAGIIAAPDETSRALQIFPFISLSLS
jgi:hypothetical protein